MVSIVQQVYSSPHPTNGSHLGIRHGLYTGKEWLIKLTMSTWRCQYCADPCNRSLYPWGGQTVRAWARHTGPRATGSLSCMSWVFIKEIKAPSIDLIRFIIGMSLWPCGRARSGLLVASNACVNLRSIQIHSSHCTTRASLLGWIGVNLNTTACRGLHLKRQHFTREAMGPPG